MFSVCFTYIGQTLGPAPANCLADVWECRSECDVLQGVYRGKTLLVVEILKAVRLGAYDVVIYYCRQLAIVYNWYMGRILRSTIGETGAGGGGHGQSHFM
jgi:hypothetical protein